MPPFLHPADAFAHAPPWMMALLVAGGAAFGLALTSGAGIVRKVRGPRPAVRLVASNQHTGAWTAEVEVAGQEAPASGWQVRTRNGRQLEPVVEVLPGDGAPRLGLVVRLDASDAVTELRFEQPGRAVWRRRFAPDVR